MSTIVAAGAGTFDQWFTAVTGVAPHAWQRELGEASSCEDRLLRIPTGFGKTAGAALPWLYHRAVLHNRAWPTRLVFCLPMRVLVEQTEGVLAGWVKRAGLEVPVVGLLGGRRETSWLEHPERPTVLVGTQDMILSRALGRGYGSSRGLWPMEMGLIGNDSLWVVDEVQLMDVGLATTTQLHGFRQADVERGRATFRPRKTWWMSATLQPTWLDTFDFAATRPSLPTTKIPASARTGGLWEVTKRLERRADVGTPEEIAALAEASHAPGDVTLVIVNTVDRARKVHQVLTKKKGRVVELVHSRFRGAERGSWTFLRRDAEVPAEGRIIVATQVVEAGVDISARTLVTDLAPWSSLVQRFGRCARYAGESGTVFVVGAAATDAKKAGPYEHAELEAASRALDDVGADVAPTSLEAFEERLAEASPDRLCALYPYTPLHVLRRRDFDDLFDTTPDLSGADLDVSRYIRSGEERDVSVFWRAMPGAPRREITDVEAPGREELCPVPVGELANLVKDKHAAYVRDYLTGTWKRADRFVPGMTVLLSAEAGGYDMRSGWDPKAAGPVPVVAPSAPATAFEATAASAEGEDLSVSPWKTVRTHGYETGVAARALARELGLGDEVADLLALAGRWHDAGKVHEVFQSAIRQTSRAEAGELGERRDLAKAPSDAWRRPPYPERPGFRHELVSTLMMLELTRRAAPDHDGLLGPHRALLEAAGTPALVPGADERVPAMPGVDELTSLSADAFDLVLYLVCAHHGKVRTSWSTTPNDQEAANGGIHGVCEGDRVGPLVLATGGDASGRFEVPSLELSLAAASIGLSPRYGASWGDRVSRLFQRYGPHGLSYLEAVFRVADWRASQLNTPEAP